MTDAELDRSYTTLCEAMSAAGEQGSKQLLGRFALLAMLEIDDVSRIDALIARASAALAQDASPASA